MSEEERGREREWIRVSFSNGKRRPHERVNWTPEQRRRRRRQEDGRRRRGSGDAWPASLRSVPSAVFSVYSDSSSSCFLLHPFTGIRSFASSFPRIKGSQEQRNQFCLCFPSPSLTVCLCVRVCVSKSAAKTSHCLLSLSFPVAPVTASSSSVKSIPIIDRQTS